MSEFSAKRKTMGRALAFAFIFGAVPMAMAQTALLPYSKVVVFGDSLSDTGNLGIWTTGASKRTENCHSAQLKYYWIPMSLRMRALAMAQPAIRAIINALMGRIRLDTR